MKRKSERKIHGARRQGNCAITRRKGSVFILMLLTITLILGCAALAVDYSILVADTNRLQRACDFAALAGAAKLKATGVDVTDEYNAKVEAQLVAWRNGVAVNYNDITVTNSMQIRVQARTQRTFFFARGVGQSNGTITRSAIAGRVALRGIYAAVPLAITLNDYTTYKAGTSFELKLIRNQDTDFAPGTIASLDLRPDGAGKSVAIFEEDLTTGYQGTVYLGQKIDNALNADINSQGNKFDLAIKQRFQEAANAPYADTGNNYAWPNYPVGDSRTVQLIVADPNPAANNNPLLVARFFAPVYIESTRNSAGNSQYIRLRILPTLTFASDDPKIAVGDADTPFTGPSAITLQQ